MTFIPNSIPEDDVRRGSVSGATAWNKFGYNADVDTAAPEVIAAFGGTFTPLTSAETFTITYNSSTDGAGGGATGAVDLTFYYLDASGVQQVAVHTLGSTGSDVTAFTGLCINRIAVSATGTNDVNVNDITVTATTSATNQAIIPAGEGVTQQVIFGACSNCTAVAKWLFINVNKISGGGGTPVVTIKGWVYNRSVDSKFEVLRYVIDTTVENTVSIADPVGFVLNGTDVIWFEAETDVNNTVVDMRMSLIEYEN